MQAFCGQRLCNGLDLTGASYAATSPEYEYYSHNPKFGRMSKFEYENNSNLFLSISGLLNQKRIQCFFTIETYEQ